MCSDLQAFHEQQNQAYSFRKDHESTQNFGVRGELKYAEVLFRQEEL